MILHCPALIVCQQSRITPGRLIDPQGLMSAIGITAFPADVTFTVHFALTEGEVAYRLALFLEQPGSADRSQFWAGDVSLRSCAVVHEQPVPVVARFSAPGQWHIALYANGQRIAAALDTHSKVIYACCGLASHLPTAFAGRAVLKPKEMQL